MESEKLNNKDRILKGSVSLSINIHKEEDKRWKRHPGNKLGIKWMMIIFISPTLQI